MCVSREFSFGDSVGGAESTCEFDSVNVAKGINAAVWSLFG